MEPDVTANSIASSPPSGAALGLPTASGTLDLYRRSGKRTADIVLAIWLLVILAIPLAIIALAIKLDSRGPVFFRVRRVGHRGRPLMMLKFRKMYDDAAGSPLTASRDPRLTRVGRVLTRARVDELPQLWDVVCGRMSIIGPRPEDPGFVALHRDEYEQILSVRPGITGLSQLAYKEEAQIVDDVSPVEDYISRILPQKLTMDKLYARAPSVRLDVRILFWTFVTVVLRHPVSVNRVTAAMRIRRRPESCRQPAEPITVAARRTGMTPSASRSIAPSGESPALVEAGLSVTRSVTPASTEV
jgi:lipopolysaccharide/colanic/teichoic acid biosynthesis glycosyltransferase